MNAPFSKQWKFVLVLLIGLTWWSCGERTDETDKEISVRKEIVLPTKETPQRSTTTASKPIDTESPSGSDEKASPDDSQVSPQVASVTKDMPEIDPQTVEGVDVSAPAEVETRQDRLSSSEQAQDASSESSEAKSPDVKVVPDETLPEGEQPVPEAVAESEDAVSESESDTEGAVSEALSLQEQPPEQPGQSEEEGTVPVEGQPEETTGEADKDIDTAVTAESGSPGSETGVSDSALASILGITRKDKKTTTGYDASGKVDPFEPLFKEEEEEPPPEEEPVAEDETTESKPKRKKRIPRTPLERMDLNQLKLVGVIRAPSGNRALVEEASGKGYIISKGTYIGIHSGKVSEILKDRVIVEEEYEDIQGEITVRKRELKIQRPPGEGFHEM